MTGPDLPPQGWSRLASGALARGGDIASSLLGILVTLFGLVLLTFVIGRTMPIDPVVAIIGDKAPPGVAERIREELGLDRSLIEQFWIYLMKLLQGDLGTSVMTGQAVTADILQFFPSTLELATSAMIVALLVGVPLGILAAARQDSIFDNIVRVISLLGYSVPVFVLALVCLLVFYAKLGIAPGTGSQGIVYQGMVPFTTGMIVLDAALDGQWDAFWDALAYLAMPAFLLAFITMSLIVRMTRAFMLEALNGEYVTAARAKGLSEARILWRHGLGNIAGRLVTVIAVIYAGLLEGTVLTETVFSRPGLGFYLTRSLLNADMNAVLGATLVIGVIYVCLNLLADLAQRLLDPRAR
ncbi:ABC transporter permease [Aquamicrobium sp. LC103]|uniref:ABC transporter permease n=1 Tax=Aquamicrobium sp. LC103 TaxID=1120658 RepID=UPI0009E65937|nr:ABC transporter permease [Aquamicrobium sp. LC103]TKT78225.1 ABC transporter permease [Aquamicrobium sp. LC103]